MRGTTSLHHSYSTARFALWSSSIYSLCWRDTTIVLAPLNMKTRGVLIRSASFDSPAAPSSRKDGQADDANSAWLAALSGTIPLHLGRLAVRAVSCLAEEKEASLFFHIHESTPTYLPPSGVFMPETPPKSQNAHV